MISKIKLFFKNIFSYNSIVPVVLFLLAFIVRIIGIDYGLEENEPFPYRWPDENNVLSMSMAYFQNFWTIKVGHFFYFISFFVFAFKFLIGYISGQYSSLSDFQSMAWTNPGSLYLTGRLWVAFLSSLTVVSVYFLGKKIFNKTIGIGAAIFLLLNFPHVYFAGVFRLDGAFPLMFILSAFTCAAIYDFYQNNTQSHVKKGFLYALSGIIIGLSASTKIPGLAVILPVLFTILYVYEFNPRKAFFNRYALILFLSLVVVFVLFNLPLFSSSGNFEKHFGYGVLSKGQDVTHHFSRIAAKHTWFLYASQILPDMFGSVTWIFTVISILVIIFLITKKRGISANERFYLLIMLIYIFAFFIPVGYFSRANWRDMLPILPFLFIILSYAVFYFSGIFNRRIHSIKNLVAFIFSIAVALLCVTSGARIYNHKKIFVKPDIRQIAREWIESNIPSNSTIVLDGGATYNINLAKNIHVLLQTAQKTKSKRFFKLADNALQDTITRRYKILNIGAYGDIGDTTGVLYHLKKGNGLNIEYIILSSVNYGNFYSANNEKYFPEITKKFQNSCDLIENNCTLVKEFLPEQNPGPIIKLYRVNKGEFTEHILKKFDPKNIKHGFRGYYF